MGFRAVWLCVLSVSVMIKVECLEQSAHNRVDDSVWMAPLQRLNDALASYNRLAQSMAEMYNVGQRKQQRREQRGEAAANGFDWKKPKNPSAAERWEKARRSSQVSSSSMGKRPSVTEVAAHTLGLLSSLGERMHSTLVGIGDEEENADEPTSYRDFGQESSDLMEMEQRRRLKEHGGKKQELPKSMMKRNIEMTPRMAEGISREAQSVSQIQCNESWTQSSVATKAHWKFTPYFECLNGSSSVSLSNLSSPQRFDEDSDKVAVYSVDCRNALSFNASLGRFEMRRSLDSTIVYSVGLNSSDAAQNGPYYALFSETDGDVTIYQDSSDNLVFSLSDTSAFSAASSEGPYLLGLNNEGVTTITATDSTGQTNTATLFSRMNNDITDIQRVRSFTMIGDDEGLEVTVSVTVTNDHVYIRVLSVSGDLSSSQRDSISILATVFELDSDYYSSDLIETATLEKDFAIGTAMTLRSDYYGYSQLLSVPLSGDIVRVDIDANRRGFLCRSGNDPLSFGLSISQTNATTIEEALDLSGDDSENNEFEVYQTGIYRDDLENVDEERTEWVLMVDMYPWNNCGYGWPLSATKSDVRGCSIANDSRSASALLNRANVKALDEYGNASYVQMKALFDESCVENNLDDLKNVTSADECSEYYSGKYYSNGTRIVNKQWFTEDCRTLRDQCLYYYQVCFDYFDQVCSCFCPRDLTGTYCQYRRSFQCEVNVLNARMDVCEAMTQAELNSHGRDDYDVDLDGDKPCFYVDEKHGYIDPELRLDCYYTRRHNGKIERLTDVRSGIHDSAVTESGYDVDYGMFGDGGSSSSSSNDSLNAQSTGNYTEFDYCVGNETSSFALSSAPDESYIRMKIFNLKRVFNDDETYWLSINGAQWSGSESITYDKKVSELDSEDYIIGGRIYVEYQFWASDRRKWVTRRFYDIDHWKMPESDELTETDTVAIIISVSVILVVGWSLWKCIRWCRKLDHQKVD